MDRVLNCSCGSEDISIYEERVFYFPRHASIYCNKCHRLVSSRSIRKATKIWNKYHGIKDRRG